VLELLAQNTGVYYTLYYGDVKDEMSRLFSKYEDKFGGATRTQRVSMPSAGSGKKSRHGVGSMEVLVHPLAFPPHVHLLHLLLVSSKITCTTVTLSLIGMSLLTYCYGGVTIS
jgi:hypothetical protein